MGKVETERRLGAERVFPAVPCQPSSTLCLTAIQTLAAGAYFSAKRLAPLKPECTAYWHPVLAHLVDMSHCVGSFFVCLFFRFSFLQFQRRFGVGVSFTFFSKGVFLFFLISTEGTMPSFCQVVVCLIKLK